MINFKKILIFTFIFMASINITAQKVGYRYDSNGNRYQRYLVCSGCSFIFNPNAADTTKNKSEAEGTKIAMENGISVYPNPTKDLVSVSINKGNRNEEEQQKEEAIFYLMENSGKVLSKKTQMGIETSFDLSSYKSGVYYIRVLYKGKNLYYKVIKAD